MEKKKRLSSLKQYPVLMAFSLFFIALFVLDMATPDRAYSEMENTTLTQRPKLTAVSVDGLNSYFTNYTKYVKDQVFGRDQWIDLQSLAETTLFQKTQSGGILLGKSTRKSCPSPRPRWTRKPASTKPRMWCRAGISSMSFRLCTTTRTSISIIARTTTGRRWGLTTPTKPSARSWA